jgi:hypothetical protein
VTLGTYPNGQSVKPRNTLAPKIDLEPTKWRTGWDAEDNKAYIFGTVIGKSRKIFHPRPPYERR